MLDVVFGVFFAFSDPLEYLLASPRYDAEVAGVTYDGV